MASINIANLALQEAGRWDYLNDCPMLETTPLSEEWDKQEIEGVSDLTMRDYFAAEALHFALSLQLVPFKTAQYAYEIADAMMEARKTK